MALVTFPASIELDLSWRPARQVQVNRSSYTRVRQALNLGREGWLVSGSIVPVSTENEARALRAFLAQVQGQQNTFNLVANGPQHTDVNPLVATGSSGAITMTVGSSSALLLAGHYVTIPLTTGKKQLVLLAANRSGNTIYLDRPLRAAADVGATVETIYPYAECALTSEAEPEDRDGTLSWSFEAEEVW